MTARSTGAREFVISIKMIQKKKLSPEDGQISKQLGGAFSGNMRGVYKYEANLMCYLSWGNIAIML